jgi:PAS domain S-box-containing protein
MKFNIKGNIQLLFIALMAISVIAISGFTYRAVRQNKIEEKKLSLHELTLRVMDQVDYWYTERTAELRGWSTERVFVGSTEDSFIGEAARKSANIEAVQAAKRNSYFEALEVALPNGKVVVASDPRELQDASVAHRPYFQEALKGRSALSDVMAGKINGQPVFVMAVPIEQNDAVVGVMMGTINLEKFSQKFIDPIKAGGDGYAFLCDSGGVTIAHPNKASILKANIATMPWGWEFLSGKKDTLVYVSEGAVRILAHCQDTETGWHLGVTAPIGNDRAVWVAALAGALALIGLVVTAGMIFRRNNELERLVSERTAALRASEESISATLPSIGDGVVACDVGGRVVNLNLVAQTLTGWSLKEAKGRLITEVFRIVNANTGHEVEIPTFRAICEDRIIDLANHTMLIGRDGAAHPIADSCAPIHASTGEVIGAVLVFRDVTVEYRQREELRESQSRFEQLAERSRTVTWEADAQGLITYVSRVAESVLGYRPEELIGKKHLYDLYVDAERKASGTQILEGSDPNEAILGGEVAVQTKDGQTVWVSLHAVPILNADGTVKGCRASTADITQRKQAEDALHESEALQRLLLATLPVGVVIVDPVTRVIERVNEYVANLFGASVEYLVGRRCHSLLCPASEGACPVCDLGKTVDNSERVMLRVDGSTVSILKTVKQVQLGGQQKLLECFVDITERKRAEAELQQYEIQLHHAQKLESIGNLAAGIAHEINTPVQFVLNNVLFLGDAFAGFKQVHQRYHDVMEGLEAGAFKEACAAAFQDAEDGTNLDFFLSEVPPAIEQSMDGIERVKKIVHAMKEFSHPGSDKPTLTDLNGAISSTLTVCRSEWKRIAELVTCFDPELPLVPCFSSEINQVVLNIVVNAAQSIADVVEARKTEAEWKGTITVSTQRDGDWVEVRISDTGAGIPERIRNQIFDPFFTTKGVGKGTGLGLSIAHAIIEKKHRGSITLETEMGRGTTFILRLPLNVQETELEKQERFY